MTNGYDPVYPIGNDNPATNNFAFSGLTKREEFVKAAMIGYCAGMPDASYATIAVHAIRQADALIAALNEGKP